MSHSSACYFVRQKCIIKIVRNIVVQLYIFSIVFIVALNVASISNVISIFINVSMTMVRYSEDVWGANKMTQILGSNSRITSDLISICKQIAK